MKSDRVIESSTSETLLGHDVDNSLLFFALESGRFAALAGSLEVPIEIDGVTVWSAGTVLYQVVLPMSDGSGVLLHHDVGELLGKRAQPGDIQPLTAQLLTLAGIFGLLGTVIFVGHNRAKARQRQLDRESQILREHAGQLKEVGSVAGGSPGRMRGHLGTVNLGRSPQTPN